MWQSVSRVVNSRLFLKIHLVTPSSSIILELSLYHIDIIQHSNRCRFPPFHFFIAGHKLHKMESDQLQRFFRYWLFRYKPRKKSCLSFSTSYYARFVLSLRLSFKLGTASNPCSMDAPTANLANALIPVPVLYIVFVGIRSPKYCEALLECTSSFFPSSKNWFHSLQNVLATLALDHHSALPFQKVQHQHAHFASASLKRERRCRTLLGASPGSISSLLPPDLVFNAQGPSLSRELGRSRCARHALSYLRFSCHETHFVSQGSLSM